MLARKSAGPAEERVPKRKPAVLALLQLLTSVCVASHCLSREEDREALRLGVAIGPFFELLTSTRTAFRFFDSSFFGAGDGTGSGAASCTSGWAPSSFVAVDAALAGTIPKGGKPRDRAGYDK